MATGWTGDKEEGYYWVRLFHITSKPQIVYLNQYGVVCVCGSGERFSMADDVKEWVEGPLKCNADRLN